MAIFSGSHNYSFSFKEIYILLLLIFVTNIFSYGISSYFGVNRPFINVDFFLVFVLMAFGYKIIAILCLSIFILFDLLSVMSQAFIFIRLQDITYLFSFLEISPLIYQVYFFFIIFLFLAVIVVAYKFSDKLDKKSSLILLNTAIVALIIQNKSIEDNSRFYRLDSNLYLASLTNYFVTTRLLGFVENIKESNNTISEYRQARAVKDSGWIENSSNHLVVTSDQMLLIVSESWGEPLDKEINQYLISLVVPENRSVDQSGQFHFLGATIAGELRELCSMVPENFNLKVVDADFSHCLPSQLKDKGYTTKAIHGAVGNMYDRYYWYPKIGFQQMVFFENRVWPRRCHSFPGACDVDMMQIVVDFFDSNEKGFLYWLTLNSHAIYDSRDITIDVFDCDRFNITNDEVCRNLKLHAQFFFSLGEVLRRGELSNVDIVIVSDHEPRFTNRNIKEKYFETNIIPWIRMRPIIAFNK